MAIYTNKDVMVQTLKKRIGSDRQTAWKALKRIYENQTRDEQRQKTTKEDNGVGFTSLDAQFLTSLAVQYIDRGFLSEKQTSFLFTLMPKYAKQLVNGSIAEGKIVHKYGKYFTAKSDLVQYETELAKENERRVKTDLYWKDLFAQEERRQEERAFLSKEW